MMLWLGAAGLTLASAACGALVLVLARLKVPGPGAGLEGVVEGEAVATPLGVPVVYGVVEVSRYTTDSSNQRGTERVWRVEHGSSNVLLAGESIDLGDPFTRWRLQATTSRRVEPGEPLPEGVLPPPHAQRPGGAVQVRFMGVAPGQRVLVEPGGRVWIGGREAAEAHMEVKNAKRVRAVQLGVKTTAVFAAMAAVCAVLGVLI
jgi:hypothetical protein